MAGGEDVGLAIVAVQRWTGAVGDRVAEGDDLCVRGGEHFHGIEELQEVVERKRGAGLTGRPIAAPRRGDTTTGAPRMPRHRSGGPGEVHADGELFGRRAAEPARARRSAAGRIGEDAAANRRGCHAGLATSERRPLVRAGGDLSTGALQPDEHTADRHRLRAEGVGEPEAYLRSPDAWPHDQPEGLIDRPALGGLERHVEHRLGHRVAGRVRACTEAAHAATHFCPRGSWGAPAGAAIQRGVRRMIDTAVGVFTTRPSMKILDEHQTGAFALGPIPL